MKYIMIMGGGAVGALMRYLVSGWTHRLWELKNKEMAAVFPVGTLAVNLIGCLLIGLLMTLSQERLVLSGEQRAFVFVGLLGAFTTFSTFGYETMELIRHEEWFYALVNVLLSVTVGLGAVYGGIVLGRLLLR